MTKQNYMFTIYCYDGGFGWGNTGQRGWVVVGGGCKGTACAEARRQIPGGWGIRFRGMTNRVPSINCSTN